MFEEADLDERERAIREAANEFWATRFMGSGAWDRLGPYSSLEQTVLQVRQFFRQEDTGDICPPPASITSRPFLIYASSTAHSNAQVVVGTIYRDGVHRPSYAEFRQRIKEEKSSAAKQRPRRSRNAPGTSSV